MSSYLDKIMPFIQINKYKCPRCGKEYEDSERGHFPGKPCKECTQRLFRVRDLERQLLAQEFSTEQEDEKIVRQINDLLIKESHEINQQDEEALNVLTQRLFQDEKRRKKIVKEIMKLQKKTR